MTSIEIGDPYKILEVPSGCSDRDIRKQFRKLALKYHPDKGGDEKRFKEILAAYELVSDADRRKLFDYRKNEDPYRGRDPTPPSSPREYRWYSKKTDPNLYHSSDDEYYQRRKRKEEKVSAEKASRKEDASAKAKKRKDDKRDDKSKRRKKDKKGFDESDSNSSDYENYDYSGSYSSGKSPEKRKDWRKKYNKTDEFSVGEDTDTDDSMDDERLFNDIINDLRRKENAYHKWRDDQLLYRKKLKERREEEARREARMKEMERMMGGVSKGYIPPTRSSSSSKNPSSSSTQARDINKEKKESASQENRNESGISTTKIFLNLPHGVSSNEMTFIRVSIRKNGKISDILEGLKDYKVLDHFEELTAAEHGSDCNYKRRIVRTSILQQAEGLQTEGKTDKNESNKVSEKDLYEKDLVTGKGSPTLQKSSDYIFTTATLGHAWQLVLAFHHWREDNEEKKERQSFRCIKFIKCPMSMEDTEFIKNYDGRIEDDIMIHIDRSKRRKPNQIQPSEGRMNKKDLDVFVSKKNLELL